jgi:5-hydroxyisourate hydrolase
MSAISTHVLDTATGRPAAGVPVRLERRQDEGWQRIGSGVTDPDGRLRSLLPAGAALEAATYRLTFELAPWFAAQGRPEPFYPEVSVTFVVRDPGEHHHVPLLLSPFGYTTYRGS